jgi:hypothetical protein
MKSIEIVLLVLVIVLAAAYSIGLRGLGLGKVIAIPCGIVLSLATIGFALYELSRLTEKRD